MLSPVLQFLARRFHRNLGRSASCSKSGTTIILVETLAPRVLLSATSPLRLASLNGSNGFRIDGLEDNHRSGLSVSSAGDVNGDGFDDVIVSSVLIDLDPVVDGRNINYVVFGKPEGFGSAFKLSSLNGINGFRLFGPRTLDWSHADVSSAGDVNGDGFDDVIMGGANESFVVFGKSGGFEPTVHLSLLNGSNGFRLRGVSLSDQSGFSVRGAGDVNGDGFDDLIIGAPTADIEFDNSGASYVVFGKSSGFPATFELSSLNGINGFRLNGINTGDNAGADVSGAGDVNGDGFDDLIIGALSSDAGGTDSGESYVVFGKPQGFTPAFELSSLNGQNGFRLIGIDGGDQSGLAVSGAGDINGDGFDDLIISAPNADAGGIDSGECYVVFGKPGSFSAALDLSSLDGRNGFRLGGIGSYDQVGLSVSAAGDVNGDGFDDLIVGAPECNVTLEENGQPWTFIDGGESYLIYGKSGGFSPSLALSSLDGINGFRLEGVFPRTGSGWSVANAGDVNGDGFDDLITSALGADLKPNRSSAGVSYVAFGKNFTGNPGTQAGGVRADTLSGRNVSAGDILIGGGGNDRLIGDGGPDVLFGGQGNDILVMPDSSLGGPRRLLGGNGIDTLRVEGNGINLILPAIRNNRIVDIEVIDITGNGRNFLTLNVNEVLNISSHSNTLTVRQDLDDTLNLGTGWMLDSVVIIGQDSFQVFTHGIARLLVQIPSVVTGTQDSDAFTLTYSSNFLYGNITVTRSTNGGAVTNLGIFPMTAGLVLNGLGGTDSVRIVGTTGNDIITAKTSTGLIVNGSGLALNSIETRTLAGAAGDDIYKFDADTALGLFTLDESGGGRDTIDFSLTTNVGLNLSLATSVTQVVHATNLSLNLGSATTFENAIGGSANDILLGNAVRNHLIGGNGNNVLVGSDGSDNLSAGTGRDVLIGGLGLDTMNGGSGEDILIAGLTTSDTSIDRLNAIRSEWTSTKSYAARITSLRTGVGNPRTSLNAKINVLNDTGDDDSLSGGAGTDWYFRAVDDAIADLFAGEVINLL